MTTFDEMLKYLKALDEDEEIYFCGDHPYCSGTLLSVSNDGWRHYGNLGDEHLGSITIADEEYETIKTGVESNTISYDDSIGNLIEVMAFKKGCQPNKEYYYALSYRYRDSEFDEVMENINFYDTYEEAFQDLGADAEVVALYEWSDLDGDEIRECYDAAVNYKNIVSRNK